MQVARYVLPDADDATVSAAASTIGLFAANCTWQAMMQIADEQAAKIDAAHAAGRAEAFGEAAAEARRMVEANNHQCGACGLYEPCVQASREDGADSALETLAAWCEGRR